MRAEVGNVVMTCHFDQNFVSVLQHQLIELRLIVVFDPVKPPILRCLVDVAQKDKFVIGARLFQNLSEPRKLGSLK